MLKIRALKIEVNTSNGLFGVEYNFTNGLNIIRGNNSTGKSTLFQCILYGLGFEELLGGKNEKTMQSTLKDQVEYPKDTFHNVLQSFVFLEIENNDIITIKRSVVAGYRKSQLVDVYFGGILTNKNVEVDSRQMYIHDSGAASDADYGFHVFLSQFLGWELPEIMTSKGDFHKLYLQQLAPAYIIEQKSGWSDFFATMPYFGMRSTEQRVIEFLLNLDVFENEKRKQEINYHKQELINNWQKIFSEFQGLAGRIGGKLEGITNQPVIINLFDTIYISMLKDGQYFKLADLNEIQKKELTILESGTNTTVGSNVVKNEQELKRLNNELNQLSLNFDLLSPELSFDRAKLNQYDRQIKSVQDDLRKNKSALKLNKLGGDLPTAIADNVCPTCEQEISGSLLPSDIEQVPMRLEDNIAYLDAQERMILVYIEGHKNIVSDKEKDLERFQTSMTEIRQKIRSIKQELLQDERLPSLVEIEKRIDLRRRVELFNKVGELFSNLIIKLKVLSDEYEFILNSESNLSKDVLSSNDKTKLADLQSKFIHLLKVFNYQSKPFNAIQISRDSYVPVAQKLVGEHMYYNIKFDSSASDFIRCIWAYTCAMMQTSKLFNTNHPRLLILDEPKQQDISMDNFRSFLSELSKFESEQVLLFASFENSDDAFTSATHGLKFNLVNIGQKLIKPINEN